MVPTIARGKTRAVGSVVVLAAVAAVASVATTVTFAAAGKSSLLAALLRSSGGASVFLYVDDHGLGAATVDGRLRRTLVPGATGAVMLDWALDMLWYVRKGRLEVLDLEEDERTARPHVMLSGIPESGDIVGAYVVELPGNRRLVTSFQSTEFGFNWTQVRGGGVKQSGVPRRLHGPSARDRAWMRRVDRRMRGARGSLRARRLSPSVVTLGPGRMPFGKTGFELVVIDEGRPPLKCALRRDGKDVQPSEPTRPGVERCGIYRLDGTGTAWLSSDFCPIGVRGCYRACTAAGCREIPGRGTPIDWIGSSTVLATSGWAVDLEARMRSIRGASASQVP